MRRRRKKTEKKQKTEKKTEDRDETEFIGPIPPVGVGPKKSKYNGTKSYKEFLSKRIWYLMIAPKTILNRLSHPSTRLNRQVQIVFQLLYFS